MTREYKTNQAKSSGKPVFLAPALINLQPGQSIMGQPDPRSAQTLLQQPKAESFTLPSTRYCPQDVGEQRGEKCDSNSSTEPATEQPRASHKNSKSRSLERTRHSDFPSKSLHENGVHDLQRKPRPENFEDLCLQLVHSTIFQLAVSSTPEQFRKHVQPLKDEVAISLGYPDIFRSVCICDPKVSGVPVQLKSKFFTLGPRGLQVGPCKFLNLPMSDEARCLLTVRPDSQGLVRYILEYTAPLFGQESGQATFVVASQMDITTTIYELTEAAIAAHDRIDQDDSKDSVCRSDYAAIGLDGREQDASTAELDRLSSSSSSESLTGATIDWVAIAAGQRGQRRSISNRLSTLFVSKSTLADFNELVQDIKFFHSLCFTLAPAAGMGFYKISWISAYVHAHRDDLGVGLERNDPALLHELGLHLAGSEPVVLEVVWGASSRPHRMYCVPMFRTDLGCWLCFLVDGKVPTLWQPKN